ncbi:hypothetical protein AHAS_Ahas20G0105200 [Arachis hypogaea]
MCILLGEIDVDLYQSGSGSSGLYAASLDSSAQQSGNEGEDHPTEADLQQCVWRGISKREKGGSDGARHRVALLCFWPLSSWSPPLSEILHQSFWSPPSLKIAARAAAKSIQRSLLLRSFVAGRSEISAVVAAAAD